MTLRAPDDDDEVGGKPFSAFGGGKAVGVPQTRLLRSCSAPPPFLKQDGQEEVLPVRGGKPSVFDAVTDDEPAVLRSQEEFERAVSGAATYEELEAVQRKAMAVRPPREHTSGYM